MSYEHYFYVFTVDEKVIRSNDINKLYPVGTLFMFPSDVGWLWSKSIEYRYSYLTSKFIEELDVPLECKAKAILMERDYGLKHYFKE